MIHKTKTHRILSWLLAMCMIVGLLPAQAFAASIDDDPSTWPAPDEQYTAPDKNPVYLYLDFTDEDNGGIRAAHYCTTGAEMTNEIGGGAYAWTLDISYNGFDSSRPGTTYARATVSRANGAQIGQVTIPVKARPIISVDPVTANGSIGDSFNSLNLPDTVTVTAKGTNGNISVSGVPVTWDSSGYNSNLLSPTVPGTLRLTGFPQLSNENIPAFSARINLTYGFVIAPVINPFSKVYDGNTTVLPLPETPDGMASVSVRYKGRFQCRSRL